MSSSQRGTRRRSARLAFDDEEVQPVGKRAKTEINGASGKSASKVNGASAQGKKSKTSYEEDDDGFTFSRARSKKPRAAQKPQSEPIVEEPQEKPPSAAPTRRKKTTISSSQPQPVSDHEVAPKRRRSARLSGDKDEVAQTADPASPQPAKRIKKTAAPIATPKATRYPPTEREVSVEFVGAHEPELKVEKKRSPTKIALPFADTPVIKRNKEMRKGSGQSHRRSSSGLRGRRASSLMESGQSSAVPHAQVKTDDFFKHIDQSLPEPKRMRQLLTWCGSRALLGKPSGDAADHSAIMAARQIQQEILDDFASKSEMSNWFNAPESASSNITKQPNPRNAQITDRIKDLEIEIQRLQDQERAWKSLTESSSTLPQPATNTRKTHTAPDDISPSLLDDPIQSSILASLTGIALPEPTTSPPVSLAANTTPAEVSAKVSTLALSLEPTIDVFADGVHKLVQYRRAAERAADKILANTAKSLQRREREARERQGTDAVGTDDVLRALGGMLNRG